MTTKAAGRMQHIMRREACFVNDMDSVDLLGLTEWSPSWWSLMDRRLSRNADDKGLGLPPPTFRDSPSGRQVRRLPTMLATPWGCSKAGDVRLFYRTFSAEK